MEKKHIGQDEMIDHALHEKKQITVFLKTGVPIKGKVIAHDPYTMFLQTEKSQTLVYKHSITSISPIKYHRN